MARSKPHFWLFRKHTLRRQLKYFGPLCWRHASQATVRCWSYLGTPLYSNYYIRGGAAAFSVFLDSCNNDLGEAQIYKKGTQKANTELLWIVRLCTVKHVMFGFCQSPLVLKLSNKSWLPSQLSNQDWLPSCWTSQRGHCVTAVNSAVINEFNNGSQTASMYMYIYG